MAVRSRGGPTGVSGANVCVVLGGGAAGAGAWLAPAQAASVITEPAVTTLAAAPHQLLTVFP